MTSFIDQWKEDFEKAIAEVTALNEKQFSADRKDIIKTATEAMMKKESIDIYLSYLELKKELKNEKG